VSVEKAVLRLKEAGDIMGIRIHHGRIYALCGKRAHPVLAAHHPKVTRQAFSKQLQESHSAKTLWSLKGIWKKIMRNIVHPLGQGNFVTFTCGVVSIAVGAT
jgi:hypothetical protein